MIRKWSKNPILSGLMMVMLLPHHSVAAVEPMPLASDSRIKVINYQPDNVIAIHGVTFTTTQIEFSDAEEILLVESGDSAVWDATVHEHLPHMLFLKPTVFGSNTNLMVVTDKRHYHFHLTSNEDEFINTSDQTYAIRFNYPKEEQARIVAKQKRQAKQESALISARQAPEIYNWSYSYSGSKHIVPTHVFDDGEFTYMQLRKHQAVPAVFAVDNQKGEESVVNFRREGDYLVVLRTAPQFTLRDGKNTVATIFNDKAINQLKSEKKNQSKRGR